MPKIQFSVGFDHDGHGYSLDVYDAAGLVDAVREFFQLSYKGGPVTIHLEPLHDTEDCVGCQSDEERGL